MNIIKSVNRFPLFGLFIKYAGVGAIGTIVHYVALITLVEATSLAAYLCSFIGALLGAIVNYFLNYFFTFKSTTEHKTSAPRFFITALIAVIVNTGLMYLFSHVLAWNYLIAQIIVTGAVVLMTFEINRKWTF